MNRPSNKSDAAWQIFVARASSIPFVPLPQGEQAETIRANNSALIKAEVGIAFKLAEEFSAGAKINSAQTGENAAPSASKKVAKKKAANKADPDFA